MVRMDLHADVRHGRFVWLFVSIFQDLKEEKVGTRWIVA